MCKPEHVLCVFFFLIVLVPVPCYGSPDPGDANLDEAISRTQSALVIAYRCVVEAEKAGGNVTSLVVALNRVQAKVNDVGRAKFEGEYDAAVAKAQEVYWAAEGIVDDAALLKVVSETKASFDLKNRVVISAAFICFIVLFGVIGWIYFKESYRRGLLEAKVEVSTVES